MIDIKKELITNPTTLNYGKFTVTVAPMSKSGLKRFVGFHKNKVSKMNFLQVLASIGGLNSEKGTQINATVLSEVCGITGRSVTNYLNSLVKLQIIKCMSRHYKIGSKSRRYRIENKYLHWHMVKDVIALNHLNVKKKDGTPRIELLALRKLALRGFKNFKMRKEFFGKIMFRFGGLILGNLKRILNAHLVLGSNRLKFSERKFYDKNLKKMSAIIQKLCVFYGRHYKDLVKDLVAVLGQFLSNIRESINPEFVHGFGVSKFRIINFILNIAYSKCKYNVRKNGYRFNLSYKKFASYFSTKLNDYFDKKERFHEKFKPTIDLTGLIKQFKFGKFIAKCRAQFKNASYSNIHYKMTYRGYSKKFGHTYELFENEAHC